MLAAFYFSEQGEGIFQLLGWQSEGRGENITKEGTFDLGLQVLGPKYLK